MTASVADIVRRLVADGDLDLPDPGAGHTADRLLALFDLARTEPVAVARLAEAHTDAVAVLHEAGRHPRRGAVYGVWASVGRSDVRLAVDGPSDRVDSAHLRGVKPFACPDSVSSTARSSP